MKNKLLHTRHSKKRFNNEQGIATVESILLLSIFVVFFTYYLGFFGVVHTGILNSISARAYAFETFRNRTNLVYLRDSGNLAVDDILNTAQMGFRLHGIVSEKATTSNREWIATDRRIAQGRETEEDASGRVRGAANQTLVREQRKVNPVFIKTTYGICLNNTCGGA